MLSQLFFLAFAFNAVWTAPMDNANCPTVLSVAGITERYGGVIAHAIHSMHMDQLRRYKPNVTEKNSIPTVNMDLTDDRPILPDAPEVPISGKSFRTQGMRTADRVLTHMDNSKYDIKQYSTLERLVHALHMQEVWYEAEEQYKNFEKNPPTADVCRCATDVENNGIMEMLRFIALEVREPALMYGKHMKLANGDVSWDGNAYNYGFHAQLKASKNVKNGNLLLSSEDVIPSLKNENAWAHWKKLMIDMQSSDDFELGLYLYCALNANK